MGTQVRQLYALDTPPSTVAPTPFLIKLTASSIVWNEGRAAALKRLRAGVCAEALADEPLSPLRHQRP
jgi:hypothetical protein